MSLFACVLDCLMQLFGVGCRCARWIAWLLLCLRVRLLDSRCTCLCICWLVCLFVVLIVSMLGGLLVCLLACLLAYWSVWCCGWLLLCVCLFERVFVCWFAC